MLIPTKEVKSFPNNKPWVTREVANVLRERHQAFKAGDTPEVKRLQKEARKVILESKKKFRDKIEDSFASNDTRQVWSGLQTMTGYKPGKRALDVEDQQQLADELNTFYGRFDTADFSTERASVLAELSKKDDRIEEITEEEVSQQFKHVNPRSACGPDSLPGAVLKHCHDSLAPVFRVLFQECLDADQIPLLWKTSNIIPVPKKTFPIHP
jgi:hypothetical protein